MENRLPRTVLKSIELVKCIDICIFYFEQLNYLLTLLRSVVFKSKQGVSIDGKYWLVGCNIGSSEKICYVIDDVDVTVSIRVEGSIKVSIRGIYFIIF